MTGEPKTYHINGNLVTPYELIARAREQGCEDWVPGETETAAIAADYLRRKCHWVVGRASDLKELK